MRIKGIKQIDSALSKWLRKQGFPLKARMSTDFMYVDEPGIITYAFLVPEKHDMLYLQVCKQLRPEIVNCDNFVLSFLHEVGHFMTEEMFTDIDYEGYLNMQEAFDNKDELADEDYIYYYTSDVEREATIWALDYIINHTKQVQKLCRKVNKLQRKFIKKNNLENP